MNEEHVITRNYLEAKNFLLATEVMNHHNRITSFDAYVEYKFKNRTISGKAIVSITMEDTVHDGDVEIDGADFQIGTVHTGFNTAYQIYEFDRVSMKLIIRGSSRLMGNNYQVEITPL